MLTVLLLSLLAAPPAQGSTTMGPLSNPALSSPRTPTCVATIADLQALEPPAPAAGSIACVLVLGFDTVGDGGGGS